jgi:hypothetical protein
MVGFAVAILATALLSNYWAVQSAPAKKNPPADAAAATPSTTKTTKKRRDKTLSQFTAGRT